MRFLAVLAWVVWVQAAAAQGWGPIQFLVGNWTGEGGGSPGRGVGAFSFVPDLGSKILVRKNFAEYPSAVGKPASRHDDLMIVYPEAGSEQLRGIYFDDEGHTIQYIIRSREGGGAVFESAGSLDTTRYRLTYMPVGPDRVRIRFEIGQPGKDFANYIEATARREPARPPRRNE